jgi:N-acetylated-alpha-linked acidic dipeptidase
MRRPTAALLAVSLGLSLPSVSLVAQAPLSAAPPFGFSLEAGRAQRALEARFDAELVAADQDAWMKRLTARPHHVGSAWGKANAEWMVEQFRAWGFEAELEEFWVLFPTPKKRRVELLAPTRFVASLTEEPLAEDATSGQTAEILPPYNAFSIDGDVTGELVYANYGLPQDYEELARRGIDVRGKIVLARYGRSWRGIKPKVAAEHGAIGCLIFSDPAEDGYGVGDPYPKGGWRPAQGVQRGSVKDAPLASGDPLTPFVGATKDAERLPLEQAEGLTRIPTLPISARDAQPLLAALAGPAVPAEWRGALPLAYHFGPGPARVRLELAFDWSVKPAYDVIARLPGSELPEQWVIRGNHQDAWVHGASDPVSGLVALLAEAKAVGKLAAQGVRPRRTLVYAAWDAEEPGLLGSTEWVEHHAQELSKHAVAYLNSDSNGRGFWGAGGSQALEPMVWEVLQEVTEPDHGVTVAARARALAQLHGNERERKAAEAGRPLPLGALGSGSDFTPFYQHLGIASLNVGFGGEEEYGQYHSVYDSYDHFKRFVDPDFRYGVALAQTAGRLTLRLANAEEAPFDFAPLASTLGSYVDEVEALAHRLRAETETENERLAQGLYELVADRRQTFVAPAPQAPVPHLNFAPLRNAQARLDATVTAWQHARAKRLASGAPLSLDEQRRLGEAALRSERVLTTPQGLPGRPWYRHQIYAPGFYTGYGVKTLPAIREAIELRRFDEVPAAIEEATQAFFRLAEQIEAARAVWAGP